MNPGTRCKKKSKKHAKKQARTGELERATQGALGVLVAADADERDGVVEQAAPVVRADFQHALVVGDGRLELAALPLQVSQIEQRLTGAAPTSKFWSRFSDSSPCGVEVSMCHTRMYQPSVGAGLVVLLCVLL